MANSNKIHEKNIVTAGLNMNEASKALIMIHGRGADASDIIVLSNHLHVKDFAILAPQAKSHSWYPYSFMAPISQNEPWLSSSLDLLREIVAEINAHNISSENIFFVGFSQGACLTLEFVARNAEKYGGIAAFTGGLIGDRIFTQSYKGDFQNTPVFIGSSNPDPHIPVERVQASTKILKSMNADVSTKLYDNMGHTISQDEITQVNRLVFNS